MLLYVHSGQLQSIARYELVPKHSVTAYLCDRVSKMCALHAYMFFLLLVFTWLLFDFADILHAAGMSVTTCLTIPRCMIG